MFSRLGFKMSLPFSCSAASACTAGVRGGTGGHVGPHARAGRQQGAGGQRAGDADRRRQLPAVRWLHVFFVWWMQIAGVLNVPW